MSGRDVLVFDVNETLLDIRALAPLFEEVVGDERLIDPWFGLLLRQSLVATVTGRYVPFDRLAVDAFVATTGRAGIDATEKDAEGVVAGMSSLPAHPDVVPALTRLGEAGFRMATLTNSRHEVVLAQMDAAGLTDHFERLLSVESVQRFKPAPEPYRYAAEALGVPIAEMRLVAAHDWDVSGAVRAGARAAFVARRGMSLGRYAERPDVIGSDLGSVAAALTS